MSRNPFVLGLRRDPDAFLESLSSEELGAVTEACARVLERRALAGDRAAGPALQALYRMLGDLKV